MNLFCICSLRRREPARGAGAAGFTFIELLVVIVVVALLAALLLPALVRQRQLVQGLQCTSNLKLLGQAFKVRPAWSGGEARVGAGTNSAITTDPVSAEQTFDRFLGLSNETSRLHMERDLAYTPKMLVCPADTRRPIRSFQEPIQNSNLSYFLNVDLRDDAPQMFWAGDRNLTNSKGIQSGLMVLRPACAVGWTQALHNRNGHVLLGDGCVQQLHDSGLRGALQKSGLTNRLAVP